MNLSRDSLAPFFVIAKRRISSYLAPYYQSPSFASHWKQYVRDAVIVGALITALVVVFNVNAATYTFVQSGWSGGISALTASHNSNRTGWTKYESATGVTAASTISLSFSSASAVDDSVGLTALSPATIAAGSSPTRIIISPDGRSGYVINSSSGSYNVSMYSRSTSTGALTALATPTIPAGSEPFGIAISPDGLSVYVTNTTAGSAGTISMYSRNTSTGALTALSPATIATENGPRGIAISPDGLTIYVANFNSGTMSIYSRNTSTGALTFFGTVSGVGTPWDLAISPDGTSLYVIENGNTIRMYSRNTSTGELTALAIPSIATGSTPRGITISPDGTSVYVANMSGNTISMYSRNTSTGALSALATPTITTGTSPQQISISPDGRTMFVTNQNSNTVGMYSRNLVTGALSFIGTSTAGTAPAGITMSPDGLSAYVTNFSNNNVSMFSRVNLGVASGFENGTHSFTALSGSGLAGSIEIAPKGELSPLSPATITTGTSPIEIAISPDGASAYVTNRNSSSVSMYSRNTSTGAWTALSPSTIAAGTNPQGLQGVIVSPDGGSVYVSNSNGSSILMYSRNTSTGLLSALSPATVSTGSNPNGIAISSEGSFVYVAAGNSVYMYSRNTSTGALAALATPSIAAGTTPKGITISPDGTSVYVANYSSNSVSMYSRNTSTGALTALATPTIASGSGPSGITISPDGMSVYVANNSSGGPGSISMYSRNTSTGALTALSPATVSTGVGPISIKISSDGMSVYVVNNSSGGTGSVSMYSRNTSTGALTALSPATVSTGSNSQGLAVSPDGTSVYVTNINGNNVSLYSRGSGYTSGTFTSSVIDTSSASSFTTISLTATTPAGTGVTIDVRAGNTATPDGSWTAWTTGLSSGGDISSLNGNRYMQYRLNLSTTDVSITPSISNVTINYSQYGASGSLTSSAFDSLSSGNVLSSIAWTASTPSGAVVKFQLRSASDTAGSPGTWSGWMGPDGTSNTYFTSANGSDVLPAALRDGMNDQWFQYKAFLSQTGGATPTLSDVTITYVVNAPPEFDASFGTGGVSVVQVASSSDPNVGKVLIQYKIRDSDTTTGTVTSGFITPTFEYNIGSGWIAIPSQNMSAGDTDNKAVSEGSYTLYEAYFNAAVLVPDTYYSAARIRVTLNDNEGANNTSVATSAPFSLDTKLPIISSMHIDGTSATNTVSFAGSDDTTIREYILSNNSDFTPDGLNPSSGVAQEVASSSLAVNTSWIFAAGSPKTVYLKLIDSRGNIATQSVVVTGAPSNIEYRDISSIDTGSYRVFVAWNLYPDPVPEGAPFGSYELYSSDDGTNFSLLYTATNPTINYYIHTPVSTSTVYYYKVAFTTSNGNRSSFSPTISDIPDGKGGTNNGAIPLISSVTATDVKNTSAKITWSTDDLALSEVDFGTTNSYGRVASNRSYVTSHGVYLTGLTPNTQYYYRVRSIDAFSGTATDNNGGAGYTFTTGGGPVISSVNVPSISDNTAEITWKTNIAANSYVSYSTSPTLLTSTEAGSDTLVESPFQHKVTLSGLTTDTLYYYKVTSTDGEGNTTVDDNQGSYYSFRTTNDEKDPVISDVSVPVKASDGAVITWRTDELSTSQVEYGTASGSTTSYMYSTVEITTPSIFHSVTLSQETLRLGGETNKLNKKTTYYYRVKSTDPAGNSAYSAEGAFTTTEDGAVNILGGGYSNDTSTASTVKPQISDVKVSDIGPFGATVSFTTNKETRAIVQYGPDTNYTFSVGSAALAGTHKVVLKGLQMNSTYHLQATAVDKVGQVAAAPDQTFKTTSLAEDLGKLSTLSDNLDSIQSKLENLIESALPSINPPFIEKPAVEDIGEDFARITWRTNVKAYGSVNYAEDADYMRTGGYVSEEAKTQEKNTEHSMDLLGLKPNTKYHFRVTSYVFPGATAQTSDMTFTTRAGRVQAQVRERKKDSMRIVWNTAIPTTSVVTYKVRGSQSTMKKSEEGLTTSHDILLNNLQPATTYEIRAYGLTAEGNTVEARDTVVASTNEDTTPPSITNFKVDSALVPGRTDRTQTIVSWKTDEPATSVVYYEEGTGSSADKLSQVKDTGSIYTDNHVVILTNLKPGTIYRFQIVSADDASNMTKLPVRTIVTPSQSESIVDVIFKNFDDTFKFMRSVR